MRKSLFLSYFMTLAIGAQAFAAATPGSESREVFPKLKQVSDPSEVKPHIGLRSGYVNTREGFNDGIEYGINSGLQVFIPFALGVDLLRSKTSRGPVEQITRTKLLARGTYNFGGSHPFWSRTYVGGVIGPVWDESNVDSTAVLTGLGPVAGFDIPLSGDQTDLAAKFTVGGELSYLHVTGNHPGSADLNAQVKYWF